MKRLKGREGIWNWFRVCDLPRGREWVNGNFLRNLRERIKGCLFGIPRGDAQFLLFASS